jgi:hypothetical protein
MVDKLNMGCGNGFADNLNCWQCPARWMGVITMAWVDGKREICLIEKCSLAWVRWEWMLFSNILGWR